MQYLVLMLVSICISLVNIPLIWVKSCNVPEKPRTEEKKPLKGEDKEMVEKALRGEWIPANVLEEIQEQRYRNKQPYLVIPVNSYEEERDELQELCKHAKEDFIFRQRKTNEYLNKYNSLSASDRHEFCDQYNRFFEVTSVAEIGAANAAVGKWFVDYIVDSGYAVSFVWTRLYSTIIIFAHLTHSTSTGILLNPAPPACNNH